MRTGRRGCIGWGLRKTRPMALTTCRPVQALSLLDLHPQPPLASWILFPVPTLLSGLTMSKSSEYEVLLKWKGMLHKKGGTCVNVPWKEVTTRIGKLHCTKSKMLMTVSLPPVYVPQIDMLPVKLWYAMNCRLHPNLKDSTVKNPHKCSLDLMK